MAPCGGQCGCNSWTTLVAAMWLMASAGLADTFSVFSEALKEGQQYSQFHVDILGTAATCGGSVGLLAALLSALLPDAAMLLIGAAMGFCSFTALWFIASGRISPAPFWLVCILLFAGFNASTFFTTPALVSSARNFPRARGRVIGVLTGVLGLSAALYTNFYAAFLPRSPIDFILLLAIGPPIIALIVAPIFCISPQGESGANESDDATNNAINTFYFTNAILAVLLFTFLYLLFGFGLNEMGSKIFAALTALSLLLPLAVPIWKCRTVSRTPVQEMSDRSVPSFATEDPKDSVERREAAGASMEQGMDGRREATLAQTMLSLDFWLNFWSLLFGGGSALTVVNNLAQIVKAEGGGSANLAVIFVSLWAFIGISLGSFLSDELVRTRGLPRPFVTAVAQVFLIFGQLLFAFTSPKFLYVACALVGAAYGATCTLVVTTTADMFGLRHFAVTANITNSAQAVGALLFSGLFASYVYDSAAMAESGGGAALLCAGAACFQRTFAAMAAAAGLSAALSAALGLRAHRAYRGLYDRHPSRRVTLEPLHAEAFR